MMKSGAYPDSETDLGRILNTPWKGGNLLQSLYFLCSSYTSYSTSTDFVLYLETFQD